MQQKSLGFVYQFHFTRQHDIAYLAYLCNNVGKYNNVDKYCRKYFKVGFLFARGKWIYSNGAWNKKCMWRGSHKFRDWVLYSLNYYLKTFSLPWRSFGHNFTRWYVTMWPVILEDTFMSVIFNITFRCMPHPIFLNLLPNLFVTFCQQM